jgi:two-component system CheB/CheR fusion protein
VSNIPADGCMACIVVQHLDPTHDTMMVELLTGHTAMTVSLVRDGMPVERGHVYVIPPGVYISVSEGTLRVSQPDGKHGARMPFDHLLRSMAIDLGRRAVCVVMSGGGSDGSLGLEAIKAKGGFGIVQDPGEAQYDGMPRSAIATGVADIVLPVAAMPAALAGYGRGLALAPSTAPKCKDTLQQRLGEITSLLQKETARDFSLYKPGTVGRRLERRMAVLGIGAEDFPRYLDVLRTDAKEVELLAKDLLIHVTSFFRDPEVFEKLSASIVPILIRDLPQNRPLRVWIPGCSTGEETYSVAMLFLEQLALAGGGEKLQIFASDIDADSIAVARSGFYSDSIVSDISPTRLARFFSKEGDGYRVSADLRACVVFTVQDVLVDPPFSRIDLVSCRNLLIYLGLEAQRKVISLFHFAIREGGMLLLGNAETVGSPDGRFEVVGEKERLYRQAGGKRISDLVLPSPKGREAKLPSPMPRAATFAELCRDLLMETYAPAGVLVDRGDVCLFFFGRADEYLKAPNGNAAQDVLAMARDDVRAKLRSALRRARSECARVVVTGGRMKLDAAGRSFTVAVQPVPGGADGMMLVCFLDQTDNRRALASVRQAAEPTGNVDLEKELDALKIKFDTAMRSHEEADEEQKAADEEALSVNEEYQSTTEELISSKEELQSLNEELSALNGQLQETLEQQRTTSNHLQNVLFSTDVATLFLDLDLKIRFFTPTIRQLFSIIPSDVGRPLADLASLALDHAVLDDARSVLSTETFIEREIASSQGIWFNRRILPYRAQGSKVEGVVITFTDITDRKRIKTALTDAKQEAERANAAKSRFLAAASHDLRQPLQSLTLLLGLLHKVGNFDQANSIASRAEESLAVMSGMLNTLLDINRIDAGAVSADVVSFPVNRLLDALREEFTFQADAQGLKLTVMPCSLCVATDPRLLEHVVRNLLSNAMKYTRRGKILMGCRRRPDGLSLEIWDTGIGIPAAHLKAIFEEYHQVDNAARDKEKGLGLGLTIVKRLGDLLGHRVHVRSRYGRGSVFGVDLALASGHPVPLTVAGRDVRADDVILTAAAIVLIVEDDADVRDLLRLYIIGEGHKAIAVADGVEALDLMARSGAALDLILADYNLPGAMDGLAVARALQARFKREIPLVVLTGDITNEAARAIAAAKCVQLTKPVDARRLMQVIKDLLSVTPPPKSLIAKRAKPAIPPSPVVFVVDDDAAVRKAVRNVFEAEGWTVEDFPTCESFLGSYDPECAGCLLVDAYLTGMDGFGLLERLAASGHVLPAIMITGHGDVAMAVRAMRAGAFDFIEKPVGRQILLASVVRALEQGRDSEMRHAVRQAAVDHIATLTSRQRQIMDLVLAGHPSKNIAADLGISQRTVENHRATIMRRTGAKSVPALARLSFTASVHEDAA